VRISELETRPPEHRRVGVRFDERRDAMQAASKVRREVGFDVHIEDSAIWIEAPKPFALNAMQILERATGTRGFNEWEGPA
jgi:hypothetical protein